VKETLRRIAISLLSKWVVSIRLRIAPISLRLL